MGPNNAYTCESILIVIIMLQSSAYYPSTEFMANRAVKRAGRRMGCGGQGKEENQAGRAEAHRVHQRRLGCQRPRRLSRRRVPGRVPGTIRWRSRKPSNDCS